MGGGRRFDPIRTHAIFNTQDVHIIHLKGGYILHVPAFTEKNTTIDSRRINGMSVLLAIFFLSADFAPILLNKRVVYMRDICSTAASLTGVNPVKIKVNSLFCQILTNIQYIYMVSRCITSKKCPGKPYQQDDTESIDSLPLHCLPTDAFNRLKINTVFPFCQILPNFDKGISTDLFNFLISKANFLFCQKNGRPLQESIYNILYREDINRDLYTIESIYTTHLSEKGVIGGKDIFSKDAKSEVKKNSGTHWEEPREDEPPKKESQYPRYIRQVAKLPEAERKNLAKELRFALHIWNKRKEVTPKNRVLHNALTEGWAKEVDLIFRVDERDPKEVFDVFNKSQEHEFWMQNIRSPRALRRHYDQLYERLILFPKKQKEEKKMVYVRPKTRKSYYD